VQRHSEPLRWGRFRKAADQGLADAQYSLGPMYSNGESVPQNFTEALSWYRKAADQGHAKAQNDIGRMYYLGEGVPRDYAEAVRWFRKAAERGGADGMYSLGVTYEQGNGVLRDNVQAHMWYSLAASRYSAEDNEKHDKALERCRRRITGTGSFRQAENGWPVFVLRVVQAASSTSNPASSAI
jgi:uncharacterized protein